VTDTGNVRIIGGKWKRRKLHFPSLPSLRPSPDASRETLFNWLSPKIAGSFCLDLFAGSGSLGFEAASRGASRVDLVETHPIVIRAIIKNSQAIQTGQTVVIHHQDAIRYLEQTEIQYDIVFLDPPFKKTILPLTFDTLIRQNSLCEAALIYVEYQSGQPLVSLPEDWSIIHHMQRGNSASILLKNNLRTQ